MTWLWYTREEYEEAVTPVTNSNKLFRARALETRFTTLQLMAKHASEIVTAVGELKQMVYEEDPPIEDADKLPEARRLVLHIAVEGENLLLLHRRLAQSRWAN